MINTHLITKNTSSVKTSLLGLSLVSALLFVPLQVNAQNDKNTADKKSQAHMQSIANPNWWQKTSKSTMSKKMPTNMPSNMTSGMQSNGNPDFSQMKSEPVSNFLKIPKDSDWHVIAGSIGVSSVKYLLTLEGKPYELAVIRMSNKVPLNAILNIWLAKVGLPIDMSVSAIDFKTKTDQSLQYYTLAGEQQSILLATHKQDKYTFFRLLGDNSSNQGLSQEVVVKFKDFLSNMEVLR